MEKNLGHLPQQSVASSSKRAWLEVDIPGGSMNKEAEKRDMEDKANNGVSLSTGHDHIGEIWETISEASQNYLPSPEGKKLRYLSSNSEPLSLLPEDQEQALKGR